IAKSYIGKGLGLDDLIAEGNLGLLRAVEGFNPAMNTRFSTYASFWIKQSLKRAIINCAKTIRIPAYVFELMVKWRRASTARQEELGRAPTHEEVADSMNLSKKQTKIIKQALRLHTGSTQSDEENSGLSFPETHTDSRVRTPDAGLVQTEDVDRVLALLK